jgi:hypothetical protein
LALREGWQLVLLRSYHFRQNRNPMICYKPAISLSESILCGYGDAFAPDESIIVCETAKDYCPCNPEDNLFFMASSQARMDRWTSHVLFEPLELVEKLAALVPPPQFNLVRYSGVFAPAALWRSQIVPFDQEEASAVYHSGCSGNDHAESPNGEDFQKQRIVIQETIHEIGPLTGLESDKTLDLRTMMSAKPNSEVMKHSVRDLFSGRGPLKTLLTLLKVDRLSKFDVGGRSAD